MSETGSRQQTRAFQAWLMLIRAQINEMQHVLEDQIDFHEGEIRRLRGQLDRSVGVGESMDAALSKVGELLERWGDEEVTEDVDLDVVEVEVKDDEDDAQPARAVSRTSARRSAQSPRPPTGKRTPPSAKGTRGANR
jgi:hypothetical protein